MEEYKTFVITHDNLEEIKRLAEIGRATEQLFKSGDEFIHYYGNGYSDLTQDVKELLKWVKER